MRHEDLTKNVLLEIHYTCHHNHPLDEVDDFDQGTVIGKWTGEIDTWGKYTILPDDGRPPYYLFREEMTVVQRLDATEIEVRKTYLRYTHCTTAVRELKKIRDYLAPYAPATMKKLRSTIKSAEGAVRNADGHWRRAQRAQEKQEAKYART